MTDLNQWLASHGITKEDLTTSNDQADLKAGDLG